MLKSLFSKATEIYEQNILSKDREAIQMHKWLVLKAALRLFNESYSNHIIFNE